MILYISSQDFFYLVAQITHHSLQTLTPTVATVVATLTALIFRTSLFTSELLKGHIEALVHLVSRIVVLVVDWIWRVLCESD
jgi:ABC-type transport system involved in cytochrome c biogenesis permease component